MPQRIDETDTSRSKVAYWRVKRRITQSDLADVTGIDLRTFKRIESGQLENPPVRYLMNIAAALGVSIRALLEDDWAWTVFDQRAAEPPERKHLFGSADKPVSKRRIRGEPLVVKADEEADRKFEAIKARHRAKPLGNRDNNESPKAGLVEPSET